MWRPRHWGLVLISHALAPEPSASVHVRQAAERRELGVPIEPSDLGIRATAAQDPDMLWYVSKGGESCVSTCSNHDKACSERGLQLIDSSEKIVRLANLSSAYKCNTALPIRADFFPAVAHGQCSYTSLRAFTFYNGGVSCNATTYDFMHRFCPCSAAGGSGEKRLTNTEGASFDALREANTTFLRYPAQGRRRPQLMVRAQIKGAGGAGGGRCATDLYNQRVWISGRLLGPAEVEISTAGLDAAAPGSLEIRVGEKVMRAEEEVLAFRPAGKYSLTLTDRRKALSDGRPSTRRNFASLVVDLGGVEIEVHWSTGSRQPNSLDLLATHLGKVGRSWGGVLGSDDPSWVSTFDSQCNETRGAPQSLVGAERPPRVWYARASLD